MSLLAQLNLPARSPAASGKAELPDPLFEQFRRFIYEQTGIYFQDNKKYLLESRVGRRLTATGTPDYQAYFHYLLNGGAATELPELINAVTINETFFFRTPPQFEIIEEHIIPELVAQRTGPAPTLRLWSAACSTGDEPYSLALIVRDRLQARYPRVRFEIYGTDINTEVLETARAGSYGPRAVRNVPPPMLSRYFTVERDHYTLKPEVRETVRFAYLNLFDRNAVATMRNIDLILCANVLIYFDNKSKQQVVSSLYNSLNKGGYLLVGFSETLYGVTQAFQPVRFDKTIAYKKG
ncbi:protein-glutamate O-methyltransferase CheR [Rhodocaloribacter litoris]|uniref:CheR family methyltransferase n=1 Tax=Rhodocaloribacter litoris TaxID=2558931 RepID=UPI00142085E2|nr:protein-glutamate O-methyltransferase CheR [Rhodocaloribacter litoris]QXD16051.1 protein-glutamate O-methyltransferase CheR [Rhodocaloribacter litoris]